VDGPSAFATRIAANGGKETLYPEYEDTVKKLIADMAATRVR